MRRFFLIFLPIFCLFLASCSSSEKKRWDGKRWNVLLISLDTVRADRLGAYGHDRPDISPAIDGLAQQGVRFARAVSQAPWTTPSHMSLLTSQYPSTHRVNQGWASFVTLGQWGSRYRTLPSSALTLAEVLRERDYKTMAMTGGGTIAGEIGFDQGFDTFEEYVEPLEQRKRMTELLESTGGEPFFFFLQSFEAHAPYFRSHYADSVLTKEQQQIIAETANAKDSLNEIAQYLIREGLFRAEVTTALYDGDIHYADVGLEWLFGELQRLGLYDNTLIVVTSDHGEEFGEHDPTHLWDAHCFTVYDELTHVPLIIRAPEDGTPAGTVVEHQVELIDVAPTVLDLLGIRQPEEFHGVSLKPLMLGKAPQEEPWAMSEATCSGPEMKSIRSRRYKYIAAFSADDEDRKGFPREPEWEELYDLEEDPGEKNNLRDSAPELLAELREKLAERLRIAESRSSGGGGPIRSLKKNTVDRLRSLGYVE